MPITTCPQCGTALPAGAPQGLCPKCLLQHGMNVTIASDEAHPSIVAKPTIRYFGGYELDHEIAHGAMGAVFKARQVTLNRPVAVKMILEGLLADDAMVKRFYTEAEAAANLQHPNIVAIHEIGAHDGQHYFSMDYVAGKDLSKITGGKPLPAARAARYVQSMANGIHYAHQRGTLHRDLKPSNVLIDEHDQPRITDFGLAKLANSGSNLTVDGAVMGTPSYMSPEQAGGRQDQIGPHSDVYSLGAILYELLTGRPPFQAATLMATMRAVIESDPVPPRRLNPSVPKDMEAVCLKCLEKRPERRYHSAQVFAEELGRFLNREPVQAKPASPLRKAVNWSVRHPWVIVLSASILVLGLLAMVYGLWEQNHYLSWTNSHPGYVREFGERTARVEAMSSISKGLFIFLVVCLITLEIKSGKVPETPVRKALHPHFLLIFGLLGLSGISFATFWVLKLIAAYVWEDFPNGVIHLASIFFLGSWLVGTAAREYFEFNRERETLREGSGPSVREPWKRPPHLFLHVFLVLIIWFLGASTLIFFGSEVAPRLPAPASWVIAVVFVSSLVGAAYRSARWRPLVLAFLGGMLYVGLMILLDLDVTTRRGRMSDLNFVLRGGAFWLWWCLATKSARAFAAPRSNQGIAPARKSETS